MKKTVLPLVVLGLASICDPENPPDLSTTANSLTSDKEPTTLALKEILQDGDEDLNFIDIGPFLKIIRASKENEDFKKMVDFYGEKKMMDKFVELSKKLSVYSAVDDENILIKKIKEIFIEFFESSVISDIDKMDIIYSIIGILIVNWSFKLVKKRKILKKIEKLMNDESIKMEELREFYCDLNNNPLSFDELLTNIINDLLKIGRVSDRKLLFELKCRFEDYFYYHDAKKKIFEILNINKFRIEDIKAYYLQKQTNNSDDVNIGKKVLKEFEKSFKELVNRVSEMLNRGETDEEIAVVIYKEYLDFFEHHKEIAKGFYKTCHIFSGR